MKKTQKSVQKLELNRETRRTLESPELQQVVGGRMNPRDTMTDCESRLPFPC